MKKGSPSIFSDKIAIPFLERVRKSEDFSRAIASKLPICPKWAGAIVVIIAMSGMTIWARGRISPGWFIPISLMQNIESRGRRASVRGTPQWLL